MVRNFWKDRRGNYALLTAIVMVPLMGAVALAVDYTELVREKQDTLNALDAAGVATGRYISGGATNAQAIAYANNFFNANLSSVDPANATLTVDLPSSLTGGGTLTLRADLTYHPYFLPVAAYLLGKESSDIKYSATSQVRLKNTLEVALVLDNSGSMNENGYGTSIKRLDVLKNFGKGLIDLVSAQAALISQVNKPVQFGLVPFAASVNVGPDYYYKTRATWLDLNGTSPIHHENFNWNSFPQTTTNTCSDPSGKCIQKTGGMVMARGSGWGALQDKPLTRFTLFDETKYMTSSGAVPAAKWGGCVESRPYPLNVNDTPPDQNNPATLFVPMFAPDEAGEAWTTSSIDYWSLNAYSAPNSWWNDDTASSAGAVSRQSNMTKYFKVRPAGNSLPSGKGPNYSCTTTPITPLTDVTDATQRTAMKNAIDGMVANGATNVPEAMAWGWRVLSSGPPFTGGRLESERGNDKVLIVLTDGANTYYTPSSLGFSDSAGNKSTYSAYGYAATNYDGQSGVKRIFKGTTLSVSYDNDTYTKAMSQHLVRGATDPAATVCKNAKDAGIIVMTIALDLNQSDPAEVSQIQSLQDCSSFSRRTAGKKLFWNTRSNDMDQVTHEIADELSNLRIVG
ncbi:MAG: hypothetical protein J0I98_01620 [Mesorhizobium sp.]|nr:pilus assembly protein [Mesorhizobium sp.]MBN9241472.1 hypothetical protein [Mesorhizobium sp.]